MGPPREAEAGATCGACGLCENRKKTLGAIFERLASLLGQEGALSSPTTLKALKQGVNNGQYVVAQLRPHAPAPHTVPIPTQEELQSMPLNDPRGVGRAAPGGVAASMYLGGGGRATHWHPEERRPGAQDFSSARVERSTPTAYAPAHVPCLPRPRSYTDWDSTPLTSYPLQPTSYSDTEDEHEGEDRLESVE